MTQPNDVGCEVELMGVEKSCLDMTGFELTPGDFGLVDRALKKAEERLALTFGAAHKTAAERPIEERSAGSAMLQIVGLCQVS